MPEDTPESQNPAPQPAPQYDRPSRDDRDNPYDDLGGGRHTYYQTGTLPKPEEAAVQAVTPRPIHAEQTTELPDAAEAAKMPETFKTIGRPHLEAARKILDEASQRKDADARRQRAIDNGHPSVSSALKVVVNAPPNNPDQQ